MQNNYEYSKKLFNFSLTNSCQFIYASSASVYGLGRNGFKECAEAELPINAYAYSKFLFDQWVRNRVGNARSQVVGLRYFNVYGSGEAHKGSMVSPILHFFRNYIEKNTIELFETLPAHASAEYARDFVSVADCVKLNMWFLDRPDVSGIFNVGTGRARSFNDVAKIMQSVIDNNINELIDIVRKPFPSHLIGSYQAFTEADLNNLRAAGYVEPFEDIEHGVKKYVQSLMFDQR